MAILRLHIDSKLIEALVPHIQKAIDEGLLSEEEAVAAAVEEIVLQGLEFETDL